MVRGQEALTLERCSTTGVMQLRWSMHAAPRAAPPRHVWFLKKPSLRSHLRPANHRHKLVAGLRGAGSLLQPGGEMNDV